jgi:transcriptional regulator with XRE-family HTH domain
MGKTLGEQAKAFRLAKGWTTAQMGAEVGGVSRQNIESLEASGNRLPKYIGDLAHLMGVTVDEMLAEAGMFKKPPPVIERWPFERMPLSRVTALSPPDRAYVEGRLEEAIGVCEVRHYTPAPSIALPRRPLKKNPQPDRNNRTDAVVNKAPPPAKKGQKRE